MQHPHDLHPANGTPCARAAPALSAPRGAPVLALQQRRHLLVRGGNGASSSSCGLHVRRAAAARAPGARSRARTSDTPRTTRADTRRIPQPLVRPLQILEHQHHRALFGQALEEQPPTANRSTRSASPRSSRRSRFASRGPCRPLLSSGTCSATAASFSRAVSRSSPSGSRLACAPSPPTPSRRLPRHRQDSGPGATNVLGEPVHVLEELPCQPGFADPGDPGDLHQLRPATVPPRRETAPSPTAAPAPGPQTAPPSPSDRNAPPRTGGPLAPHAKAAPAPSCLSAGAPLHPRTRPPARSIAASPPPPAPFLARPPPGSATAVFTQISGHHSFADSSQVHRRLSGEHTGAGAQVRRPHLVPQRAHRRDEIERCAHRALRVVLPAPPASPTLPSPRPR